MPTDNAQRLDIQAVAKYVEMITVLLHEEKTTVSSSYMLAVGSVAVVAVRSHQILSSRALKSTIQHRQIRCYWSSVPIVPRTPNVTIVAFWIGANAHNHPRFSRSNYII